MSPRPDRPITLRRGLSWALAVALCVAGLTAIGAILGGDFDELDVRVIATSLGFAVFSATAASGASLRSRASGSVRTFGWVTVALSVISFMLFLVSLWSDDDDGAWRWFGCAAIAALACSHASLVAGALRAGDTVTIRAVASVSMVLAAVDSACGVLAVSGAVDEVDDSVAKVMAALVVALLLTSALPPILRRMHPPPEAPAQKIDMLMGADGPAPRGSHRPSTPRLLATELLAVADRIDALSADPGNRSSEIGHECARLRELARAYLR